MSAASSLPWAPWSPTADSRERRAAMAALGLSVGVHLAALGLLPLGRPDAPPPLPPIQVSLLAPPPQPLPAPPAAPARALPLTPPRVVTEASPPAPAPRPAVLTRNQPAPAELPIHPRPVESPVTVPNPPAPAPVTAETHAPAPAVAAVVATPAPDPALLARYGQTLSGLLARQQQYPRLAATRGWEGEVVLKLVIARKGNLVNARVVQSSGYPVLDEHALALVTEVQPFPALPLAVPGEDLEVTVPVHYQLKKS